MKSPLSSSAIGQLFQDAHTAHAFKPRALSDQDIQQLYDTMKWGPTAFNASPARFVFVRSQEAKARLIPALSPGNVPQVQAASVTVIVAHDTTFYEHLPRLFPAYDAKPIYANNAAAAEDAAFRNGTLQGAYLILAARALGFDCGPMSGFDAQKVNAEFFPDGRVRVNFLLNIGEADPAGVYPRNDRMAFHEAAQIL
jgi:3-hydroxypropanoate dehydrogenase